MNAILDAYSRRAGSIDSFRRSVSEIVRAYRHPWDILAELAQNSIDAINRLGRDDTSFKGDFQIRINPAAKTVSVSDNGCGMSPEEAMRALAPGESFKTLGRDYGYKGFGLTFVAFSSANLRIRTIRGGKLTELQMTGNLEWLGDTSAALPEPVISVSETSSAPGTMIEVALAPGEYAQKFPAIAVLDDMFKWAAESKQLEYVLRTRTAVGNTKPLFDHEPDVPIRVQINTGSGDNEIPYKFLSPLESGYARQDTYTLYEYIGRYTDGRLSLDAKRYRALIDKISAGVGHNEWLKFDAALIICGRTGTTRLAEELGVSDAGLQLGTGFHLALNGMPTGIDLAEGRLDAFSQRYFVLIDADLRLSDQLDSGRKGISRYFADQIIGKVQDHITTVVPGAGKASLRTFATLMLNPESDPGIDRDILEKFKEQNSLEDIDGAYCVKKVPDDENEVIALFFELVGRNDLPGYRAIFLSQATRYDGVFEFNIELNDRTVWSDSDPSTLSLGTRAQEERRKGNTDYAWEDEKGGRWFTVEFKTKAQDLVASTRNRQSISQLTLLIAWDADYEKIRDLGGSLETMKPIDRPMIGVTHRLTFQGHTCLCILLKDVVTLLATRGGKEKQAKS